MKPPAIILAMATLLGAGAAFAQDTSVNVNAIEAPELVSVPVIDGDPSDAAWANVPETPVTGSGDAPAPTDEGDLDITMKAAWDEETNALYFLFHVTDDAFINVEGLGASGGGSGWHNERLEIVVNAENTGEAGHGEGSEFHTQYIFDLPNTIDDAPVGLADVPASAEFVQVPVFEGVDGSIQFPDYPFDFSNDFIESAARIRVTDPAAAEWLEAPVEWYWEIKLVTHSELFDTGAIGTDTSDPAAIADGFKAFFEDPVNIVKDLQEGLVIGISPQQNDSDVFEVPANREHQVNTTNRAGNWDSSAELTGLILAPAPAGVTDWDLLN